jgi:hypothetical protein
MPGHLLELALGERQLVSLDLELAREHHEPFPVPHREPLRHRNGLRVRNLRRQSAPAFRIFQPLPLGGQLVIGGAQGLAHAVETELGLHQRFPQGQRARTRIGSLLREEPVEARA